jgi:hypothetical protein
MTRPMIQIHDISTNEVIDREMTDAEFEQHERDQAKEAAKLQAASAASEAKNALLDRLGITDEEAKLLLS